jgi:hypothetical protein
MCETSKYLLRTNFLFSEYGEDLLRSVFNFLTVEDPQYKVTRDDETTITGAIDALYLEQDRLTIDLELYVSPTKVRLIIDSDFDFNVDTRETKNYVVKAVDIRIME